MEDRSNMDNFTLPPGHSRTEDSTPGNEYSCATPNHIVSTAGNENPGTRNVRPEFLKGEELVHEKLKASFSKQRKPDELPDEELKYENVAVSVAGEGRAKTDTTSRSSLQDSCESNTVIEPSSTSSSSPSSSLNNYSFSHPTSESLNENSSAQYLCEEARTISDDLTLNIETPVNSSNHETETDDTSGLDLPVVVYASSSELDDQTSSDGRGQAVIINMHTKKKSKRACYHRSYLTQEGPPCYLCSMSDLPPKYKSETSGWRKSKKKFVDAFQRLVNLDFWNIKQETTPPPDVEGNGVPFTVSNGITSWDIYSAPPEPYVMSSRSPLPATVSISVDEGDSGTQVDDTPRVNHQANGPPYQGYQNDAYVPSSLGSNLDIASHSETTPIAHPGPTPPPTDSVPPPYSPPTPGSLISGFSQQMWQQQQEQQQQERQAEQQRSPEQLREAVSCTKNMQYNLLYSILLATVTSVTVVGYDQPIVLIGCIIVFLTFFFFMPLIWFLECILRLKTAGSLRSTMQNLASNAFLNSTISPPVR